MFELESYLITVLLNAISTAFGVVIGWKYRDKRANFDAKAHAEATADAILYSMNGYDNETLRGLYQNGSDSHLKLMKKGNN